MQKVYEYEWPVTNEDILQIRGLYRVPLPDDKHPDAVLETLEGQSVWVSKQKFTSIHNVEREVKKINEWRRQRGGKPKSPVNKPKPSEYLKNEHAV